MNINFLKSMIRNMAKNRPFTFINLAGLAIGIACAFYILLWVQDELSFDQFHTHKNDLYRIVRTNENESYYTYHVPGALADALKSDYPEITNATNYCRLPATKLSKDMKGFYSDLRFVDAAFFQMFDFPLKSGAWFTDTGNPQSIVISEDLAQKLFGDENAVGNTITMDDSQELLITGVMANCPANSHIQFDGLLPMQLAPESARIWTNNWPYTYIQLDPHASQETVINKIGRTLQRYKHNSKDIITLQSLVSAHLHSYQDTSRMTYVFIFSALGIVVLITACINFINLVTAQSDRRAKEISIKKVVGSSQKQLTLQFLFETIVYVAIATCMAIVLVQLALPHMNHLTAKQIHLQFGPQTITMLLGIVLITGTIAGLYPAIVLSSQQPISVLRNRSKKAFKHSCLRKGLIVLQYVFSVFLIISVLVFRQQLNHLQNKNLGFNKEHVLVLNTRGEIAVNSIMIRNELLKYPDIRQITVSVNPIEKRKSDGLVKYGVDKKINCAFNYVDSDFQKTLQIDMAYGHFFSDIFQSELGSGAVINESAMRALGIEDPVGKMIVRQRSSAHSETFTIIGVMKDFHNESLHQKIRPLMMMHSPQGQYMYLRVAPGHLTATINHIEKTIKTLIPNEPFSYQFLDENIRRFYHSEKIMSRLTLYITFLAVFISALGLLGLVTFSVAQRTKEIGIRKILGSSNTNVMKLLTKEYLKLIVIANIIAWPIAWYVMNKWLQNFAYRTELTLLPFVLSGILALLIALFTVSWQVTRAATANPVKSLRHE